MLVLFDSSQNRILSFATYKTLHNHIQSVERAHENERWLFTRHSWARMVSCYKYVRARDNAPPFEETFEKALEKALAKGAGGMHKEKVSIVLEIISGNPHEPVFIPLTPEVDTADLLQKWCQSYCKAHKHRLFHISYPHEVKEMGRVL